MLKERTFLSGIVLALTGIVFALLDIPSIGISMIVLGTILTYVGELILFKTPDKGAILGAFVIEGDDITIIDKKFKLNELKDLKFELVDFEGGPTSSRFKQSAGNENVISFRLNERLLTMNFYIPTIKHFNDLNEFLQERNVPHSVRKRYWLWG